MLQLADLRGARPATPTPLTVGGHDFKKALAALGVLELVSA